MRTHKFENYNKNYFNLNFKTHTPHVNIDFIDHDVEIDAPAQNKTLHVHRHSRRRRWHIHGGGHVFNDRHPLGRCRRLIDIRQPLVAIAAAIMA